MAVNGNNVYVAGLFDSPTISFGTATLPSAGTFDAFVTKLTDTGSNASFTWALRAGGMNADQSTGLAVNGNSVFVSGSTGSPSASFGSTTLTNPANATFNDDGFLAKIMDAGTSAGFACAKQLGGAANDVANAVTINGPNIYVAGILAPPANFDSHVVATPAGSNIGFLATLTDPTLTATTAARGSFSFTLAPNPAHASTRVQLPNLPGPATLTLLDALGRAVRTRPATPGTRTEFDLSGLAPGLYALRATAGAATATQRLVVE